MTAIHFRKKRGFPFRFFLVGVLAVAGYRLATKPDSPLSKNVAPPSAQAKVLSTKAGSSKPEKLTPSGGKEPISRFFKGDSDSVVARTVGHTEGTRTADGSKTRAYYGHSDPGNGVWNLGSFSYQHGAKSPEDADAKQLPVLLGQAKKIVKRANKAGFDISLEEALNAIDLGNQAPKAVFGNQGYIERLKQAKDKGLKGSKAILWARTQSYWDPAKGRWDASGLGNTEANIKHDQNRRMTAIARALDTLKQQQKLAVSPDVKVLPQALVQVTPTAFAVAGLPLKREFPLPTAFPIAEPPPAPVADVPAITHNLNTLSTPGDVRSGWSW